MLFNLVMLRLLLSFLSVRMMVCSILKKEMGYITGAEVSDHIMPNFYGEMLASTETTFTLSLSVNKILPDIAFYEICVVKLNRDHNGFPRFLKPDPKSWIDYSSYIKESRADLPYITARFRASILPPKFTIGNGRHYSGFLNGVLQPDTYYAVFVRGVIQRDGRTYHVVSNYVSDTKTPDIPELFFTKKPSNDKLINLSIMLGTLAVLITLTFLILLLKGYILGRPNRKSVRKLDRTSFPLLKDKSLSDVDTDACTSYQNSMQNRIEVSSYPKQIAENKNDTKGNGQGETDKENNNLKLIANDCSDKLHNDSNQKKNQQNSSTKSSSLVNTTQKLNSLGASRPRATRTTAPKSLPVKKQEISDYLGNPEHNSTNSSFNSSGIATSMFDITGDNKVDAERIRLRMRAYRYLIAEKMAGNLPRAIEVNEILAGRIEIPDNIAKNLVKLKIGKSVSSVTVNEDGV